MLVSTIFSQLLILNNQLNYLFYFLENNICLNQIIIKFCNFMIYALKNINGLTSTIDNYYYKYY